MTSVTFPTSLGGSGITVSDDANPSTGLANGGHRTRFVPALQGAVAMAGYTAQYAVKIDNAAADADRAENARGYVEAVADQYQVNILEQFKNQATLVSDFAQHDYRLYDGLRTHKVTDTDIWTITRATTGSYVDATGKIRTAAIDEPRYTYNPATGDAMGLIVDPTKTNFILNSENFSLSPWQKDPSTTVEANFDYAPDGTLSADKVDVLSTGIYQTRPVTEGLRYSASVYVKLLSAEKHFFGVLNATNGAWIVDPNTNESLANSLGWTRVEITFIAPEGCDSIRFYVCRGNVSSGEQLIWGAQLEEGVVSSYIPTQGSSTTRSIDITERLLGSEFSPEKGTIFCDSFIESVDVQSLFFSLGSSDITRNRYQVDYLASNNAIRFVSTDSSGNLNLPVQVPLATGLGRVKVGLSWDTTNGKVILSANGSSATANIGSLGSANYIALGKRYGVTSRPGPLNGSSRCILYQPYPLTTAALETLTAI